MMKTNTLPARPAHPAAPATPALAIAIKEDVGEEPHRASAPGGIGLDRTKYIAGSVLERTGDAAVGVGALMLSALATRYAPQFEAKLGVANNSTHVKLAANSPLMREPISLDVTEPVSFERWTLGSLSLGSLLERPALLVAVPAVTGAVLGSLGRALKSSARESQDGPLRGGPTAISGLPSGLAALAQVAGTALVVSSSAGLMFSSALSAVHFEGDLQGALRTSGLAHTGILGDLEANATATLSGSLSARGALSAAGFGALTPAAGQALLSVLLASGLGLIAAGAALRHAHRGQRLEASVAAVR